MERNERVDAFRVLAIIAVIIIHTQPFEHQDFSSDEHLGVAAILNQASRFAVPVFFAMSGYFLG
jgi:surface polysaccharide O-acyltransferase-like enzyme